MSRLLTVAGQLSSSVDIHNPKISGSDEHWRRVWILQVLIQEHKLVLDANISSVHL